MTGQRFSWSAVTQDPGLVQTLATIDVDVMTVVAGIGYDRMDRMDRMRMGFIWCVNTMVSCSEHVRNINGDMVLFLHCYIAVNLPQANVGVSRKNGCENRDISHIEIAIEIGNTIINQICSGTLFSNKATCLWGFPKMGLEMVPHPQIHQRKEGDQITTKRTSVLRPWGLSKVLGWKLGNWNSWIHTNHYFLFLNESANRGNFPVDFPFP